MKLVSNEDFMVLTPCQKIDKVAKLYFLRCSQVNIFRNGKISPDYFKVRSFLKTKSDTQVKVLYDYLLTIEGVTPMSLSQVFDNSEKYRVSRNREAEKPDVPVEQYKDVSLEEIMGW